MSRSAFGCGKRITLAALAFACSSCSLHHLGAMYPNAARIGGPLMVDGPLVVHGPVTVGGPCIVHGPVQAAGLKVGGPVYTLPLRRPAGPAGQEFASPLYVGGPLTVNGPLIADGELTVGGPFTSDGLSGPPRRRIETSTGAHPMEVYNSQQTNPDYPQQAPSPSVLELPKQEAPGQTELYPPSPQNKIPE